MDIAKRGVVEARIRIDSIPDLDVDNVVRGFAEIHEQLMECVAADRAAEDLLEQVERGFHEDVIEMSAFIKVGMGVVNE